MKKLTQIVIAALITSSAYAETLTFHGREEMLADYGGDVFISALRKNVRVTLYNPNNFDVKIRLSSRQAASLQEPTNPREPSRGSSSFETLTAIGNPQIITIGAKSGYVHLTSPSILFPENIRENSDLEEGQMCDLDMYQSLIHNYDIYITGGQHLNCASAPRIIEISWQSSFLRNGDSSIKTVAPITGTLDYFYNREGTAGRGD